MPADQGFAQTSRRTRWTLYIVVGSYVGLGLLLAVPSARSGDRLSALLGFAIVGVTLGFAAVLSVVFRLSARMSAVGESLDEIRERLQGLEELGHSQIRAEPVERHEHATRSLDLSAIGPGNPSLLAATTLDRSEFPRLVTAMDDGPHPVQDANGPRDATVKEREQKENLEVLAGDARRPDRSHTEQADSPADAPAGVMNTTREREERDPVPGSLPASGLAEKNPLRVWKAALRNSDLATCREVFSALVDTADPDLVAELERQLQGLSERTERSFREAFSRCVREGDYTGALSVGEEIRRLFPDQSIAREFGEIEPYLSHRLRQQQDGDPPPQLVVH
jgi:hypothetical protein